MTPVESCRYMARFRSRRVVAAIVGIHPDTLKAIEVGEAWPRPKTIKALADVYGMDPELLALEIWRSNREAQEGTR